MAKKKDTSVAQNRKARYNYHIIEAIEAGIVLKGTEIKSIRKGQISLQDGFAGFRGDELFLYNVHIAPFKEGNQFNHDPLRTRKLLLKRQELNRLIGLSQQQGHSIVPLKVYIKNGVAKVLIGLAKGKKQYDKRESIKRKDQKREIQRALKDRYN
ncbi:MAG: SsrA-binding protein SmpB [Lactococcus lactis]|nr:SsrA-binding protein SmpB [Lactococcus lactis]